MKKLINIFNRFIKIHPDKAFLFLYFGCLLLASVIVFLRFPNNFTAPNFYGEDGSIYFINIHRDGYLRALMTSFNGYFITGLYLILGLGLAINSVLFSSNFADLPRSLSIVSYLFIGFSITLPLLLFRKQLKPYWAVLLVLLSAFIPLRQSDYAVLGTIGNLKWLFLYIAFLLAVYRYINYKQKWNRLILVDLGILICAYTNSATYLLIPIIFLPYILDTLKIYKNTKKFNFTQPNSIWSLCALAVLLLPQLIYVKINGIPRIVGYLDTPFNSSRAIEIFIGRSFEYGFTYGFYGPFSNLLAMVVFVVTILFLYFFYDKKYRPILFIGIYAVFCATLLFVINRPGISDYFFGYKNGGPDQFFYAQNLIVYFVTIAAFFSKNISKMTKYLIIFFLILFIFANLPFSSSVGRNDFMQKNRGDIYSKLKAQCQKPAEKFTLAIYPVEGWEMPANKTFACRGVKK